MSSTNVMGGAGNAAGSLLGYWLTSGDRSAAQGDYEKAEQGFAGLDPNIAAQTAGPSSFDSISIDPKDRAAQLGALTQLENIYKSGGLDASTKAQLQSVDQDTSRQAKAMDSTVANNMSQRGLGSSGASFAQQESNDQAAANREGQAGTQALAMGQGNKMAALQGASSIGSNLQSQDYGQAASRAAAEDAISKFNANQKQGAEEQTFTNSLGKQQGEAGALDAMAGNRSDQAKQEQGVTAGVGQAAGSVAGSLDIFGNLF